MRLFRNTSHRDHWKLFLQKYPVHSYRAGELILLQDQVPKYILIIKTGLIKTYNINKDGEERPVSFDTINEVFPIGWVFGKIEKTQYFYQALTDAEVYHMPREDYLDYLRLHPKMGYEFYAGLAARLVSLQARIYALEQSKAADKIIYTLLFLCERFGAPASAKSSRLKIPLTQQELANYVGLTRETTSTELKKLEKLGVIKYSHKQYLIYPAKLAALVE